jgi:uncharacterized protein
VPPGADAHPPGDSAALCGGDVLRCGRTRGRAHPTTGRWFGGAAHNSSRSKNRTTLITSRPLLSELGRVLTEKFDWEAPYTEEVLTQLVRVAVVVDPIEQIDDITEDPDDNRVLEAVAEGDAEVIVSGDRHLLTLSTWRGIRVLTPAVVMNELP